MKRLIFIITFLICIAHATPSFAVTEKEMDHARALATQAYLRYANDGSGYLDNVNPKSMAELEKALKAKEKENIKAFKSIPVPKDYASWDKQKLVDYWSTTAFASKGLLEKGRIGKSRARKKLNALKISAPVAKEKAAEPKPGEQTKTETPANAAQPKSEPDRASAQTTAQAVPAAPADTATTSQDPLDDPLFADLDSEPQISKAKDHTWIYIVILCVLVAVVVALVVFASNVMKKNGERIQETPSDPKPGPVVSADTNTLREKFAATLTAKNEEISLLSKKVESLNVQNMSLKSNLEGLTAEVASLRTRLTEANNKIAEYESAGAASAAIEKPAQENVRPGTPVSQPVAEIPASGKPQTPAQTQQPTRTAAVRSIFLGRANAKGIFVRADRTLNPGNSIFRLDTTDGYAGSFRVVSNPTVWEMALLTPMESLSGACVASDINATEGMTSIVNDSAGTAIFEGGCWKVIRKAKIHFE